MSIINNKYLLNKVWNACTHVTIVSACNVIQNMKQLHLHVYLFIEYRTSLHAMAARCSQSSQSQPTQDTQQNDDVQQENSTNIVFY